MTVTFDDVAAAAKRLEGQAHRTPVFTSTTLDRVTGCCAFVKCENLQRGGAFKFRGAANALALMSAQERQRGVITYSSGNHAGALALVGAILGAPVTVVMPDDAPRVKREATEGYGAEVVLYDKRQVSREELGQRLADERGLTLVPPFDHPHVIAGQGTVAMEFLEEVGPLDVLAVPCGGGGLLSGCALAVKALCPNCRVVGVEPEAGDDATRSFRTRTLQSVHNPDTIADGARTTSLGQHTFPIVLEMVDDMVTVSEEAILRATLFLWQRMKVYAEPTGALAAAALLEGQLAAKGLRVGIVVSGGNVDLPALLPLLAALQA